MFVNSEKLYRTRCIVVPPYHGTTYRGLQSENFVCSQRSELKSELWRVVGCHQSLAPTTNWDIHFVVTRIESNTKTSRQTNLMAQNRPTITSKHCCWMSLLRCTITTPMLCRAGKIWQMCVKNCSKITILLLFVVIACFENHYFSTAQ